jgi:hypothetical protein
MVSATLLRFLCAVRLFLLAIVLSITDRYYFTNAEMLCQRFSEGAETMPKILRLVSPRRFFRSRAKARSRERWLSSFSLHRAGLLKAISVQSLL